MDAITIATVISHAKAATDIVKGLVSLKTSSEVNSKAIELQTIILDLQSSLSLFQQIHFEEIEKRQNAENKIKEIEDWKQTASQYEFKKLGINGVNIFVKKPFFNSYEKDTYICPNCYNKKTESFLQPNNHSKYSHNVFCHNCNLKLEIIEKEYPQQPPLKSNADILRDTFLR
jgi:hypothetical protein